MPMDRRKYPKNWNAIAQTIKHNANWSCQECGRPCRKPGVPWKVFIHWLCDHPERRWIKETLEKDREKVQRFTLTVAHLNHDTRDNRIENLKALCPRCHLAHDRDHHITNAQATRRRKKEKYFQQIGQIRLKL